MRPIARLRLAVLSTLPILVACVSTAPVDVRLPLEAAALPLEAEIPLDPRLRSGTLENGLRYVVREAPRPPRRAQIWLVVDAGSVLETPEQRGLAHFVEHMAFNGTERFEKQEIVDLLESAGMRFGPDLNAYTSFDETVYMLQIPTDDRELFSKAFEILHEWAGAVAFDPEEVERERGVVIEEWRLSRGAGSRLMDRQLPVLLGGSRYAERLPIGEKEILETASAADLERFYRDWYRPEHLSVIAVGDFDAAAVERRIRRMFADLESPGEPPARPDLEPRPVDGGIRVSIEDDPEATGISVAVHRQRAPLPEGQLGHYREMLVDLLFFAMLDDRLEEVARGQDADLVFAGASASRFVRHVALETLGVRVGEGKVRAGLEEALRELERARRHGFTPGELERAKRELARSYEQAAKEVDNEDSRSIAAELTRHVLTAEPVPGIAVEQALAQRFLATITLAEIEERARAFLAGDDRVLMVTAPRSGDIELPSSESLLAAVEAVESAELEPWEDSSPDGPLIAEDPAPGEIVAEREHRAVGVLEWELSNGIRVLLKPTDFRQDQVLVSGWSPGGLSLVPTEELPSAMFATGIAEESGLGGHGLRELENLLAGSRAAVGLGLSDLEESVRGAASADDLETLFRLLWLRFHEPRFDADAWSRLRDRLETLIAHRRRSPDQVFAEKLEEVLTNDDPRRPEFDEALLAAVDVEAAERIYRDRFGDASDFTFAFVGSFSPATLRPLVETWLGSLPVRDREESWRDEGIERPEGQVRFEVERGVEPKSQVRLILHGEGEWSREEQHLLSSLAAAASIELRKALREDLGGTYGVGVSASLSARPRETYAVSMSFGCDPERREELLGELFAGLRRFREEGFDPATIEKVRESQRRAREIALEDNGSWLGWIETYWTLGLDPELILAYDELLASLDGERLREAAARYLREDRYVLGVLKPSPDSGADPTPTDGPESFSAAGSVSGP